jgi:hypothetical protein
MPVVGLRGYSGGQLSEIHLTKVLSQGKRRKPPLTSLGPAWLMPSGPAAMSVNVIDIIRFISDRPSPSE